MEGFMMSKKARNRLLDLDALNPSIGDVKIGGQKYKIFQPAYEDFVLMPIIFDQLGRIDDISVEDNKKDKLEQIEKMRKIVQRIIPDMDQNILTFAQLMKIVEYVSEKFAEQMAEDYTDVDKEKSGSGKGK
jgi:hypothetical protein